jgi:hypothetical protein
VVSRRELLVRGFVTRLPSLKTKQKKVLTGQIKRKEAHKSPGINNPFS